MMSHFSRAPRGNIHASSLLAVTNSTIGLHVVISFSDDKLTGQLLLMWVKFLLVSAVVVVI